MTTLKTRLSARDDFDSLRSEQEQPQRKIEIIPDSALEKLIYGFTRLVKAPLSATRGTVGDTYEISEVLMPDNHTASDVEKLCIALYDFQDSSNFSELAGVYLSAAVNHAEDNRIQLPVRVLGKRLHYLGAYLNGKNLRILGDVESHLGYEMRDGLIEVTGNAGRDIGFNSKKGKIHIRGNAESVVHVQFRGAIIKVDGTMGV